MINPTTRLVDVIVSIPRTEADHLTLGSLVQGKIQLVAKPFLVAPRSAVLEDERGAYVFRVKDGRARRVKVAVEMVEGDIVAVSGPLKPGDAIAYEGNYELSDGMKVKENSQ